jgi:hypothetical protein
MILLLIRNKSFYNLNFILMFTKFHNKVCDEFQGSKS